MSDRFAMLEVDDGKPSPAPAPEAPAPKPAPVPAAPKPVQYTTPLPAPAMKTPQGVDMTPRAARVYAYLNARGIAITTFSTDGTVHALKDKIIKAREFLAAPPTGFELHATTRDVITDIDSILSRVPENRVMADGTTVADLATDTGAGHSGVRAAQGLVALSVEGKTTGAVMYWHLSGACDLTKLTEAWKAQGLDEKILPGTPSETVALSRAAKSQANKHRLVRQHPEGGWAIVDEVEIKNEDGKTLDLNYMKGIRVRIEKDEASGEIKLLANRLPGCTMSAEAISTLLGAIRAEYNRALTEIASQDVSTWIVRLASWHLKGVALRETGGLYFIPKDHIETFKKMKTAIKAATSHVIYEIPAMHSDEAIAAVLDAIVNETEALLVEIKNEVVAKDFGARGVKSRLNALDEAKEKVIGYSKLLGRDLTDLTKRIKELRGEVATVTTRGALLEVE